MHSLGIYSIGPPLVMDKLIPVNSRVITSPPDMDPCLMSNASLQPSLNQGLSLLHTRITLVGTKHSTSRDKCTLNLSTGLSALQILRQGNRPIASQTADQLPRCFRSTPLLTHKLGMASAIEMAIESYEWSDLPSGAATATRTISGTSVIRRLRVPPRAWVGPITSWTEPDTGKI